MGIAFLGDGNASADVMPLTDVSFQEYQTGRGADPLSVVLGCGRSHNHFTVVGLPHEHEDAYTIDWGGKEGARYGVRDPHKAGNALVSATWSDIPESCLSCIRFEHFPFFDDLNPMVVGKILRELEGARTADGHTLTPEEHAAFVTQAKEIGADAAFNFCVEQARRCLRSGGILEIYPQRDGGKISLFNALEALADVDPVFPRDPRAKEEELRSTLFKRLPFDRGFSQVTLTFYDVLHSHEGCVPRLQTEFTLDFTRTLFDGNLERNNTVLAALLALQSEYVTFVTVVLTKA